MNQTNKEAAIEFVRGAGIAVFMVGVFSASIFFLSRPPEKTLTEKFKVVDTYKDCDVVRYNKQEEGRYTYFLDCQEVR